MVTFRASARVESVDPAQLPAVAAAVLDRCRRLKFDRGAVVHPSTGARIEGLSNLSNSHPREGSEYVVVTAREVLPEMNDDELTAFLALDHSDPTAFAEEEAAFFQKRRETASAAGTIRTVHDVISVRLTADDRKRVAVGISAKGDTPFTAKVRIEPPQRPTRSSVEGRASVSGHWFIDGDVDLDGDIDIESLCGHRAASAATARMTARHKRGRGSIALEISDSGLGSWNVDGTVRARGAGWFRPIAAIIGVVARPRLQRKLTAWLESGALDEAMSEVRPIFREEVSKIADSRPDAIATEVVNGLLNSLVETLPDTLVR